MAVPSVHSLALVLDCPIHFSTCLLPSTADCFFSVLLLTTIPTTFSRVIIHFIYSELSYVPFVCSRHEVVYLVVTRIRIFLDDKQHSTNLTQSNELKCHAVRRELQFT